VFFLDARMGDRLVGGRRVRIEGNDPIGLVAA
jgi:hypothetical protein